MLIASANANTAATESRPSDANASARTKSLREGDEARRDEGDGGYHGPRLILLRRSRDQVGTANTANTAKY